MTVYADLIRYRELFGNLFRRDVQAKYRGSLLGVAWTLANPILLMAVYLLVFSVLWHTQFGSAGHYGLFLLVGLAAWIFFASALQSASRSMLDNANLIRKTRFPRQLVPLAARARRRPAVVVVNYGLNSILRRGNAARRAALRASLRSVAAVVCLGESQRRELLGLPAWRPGGDEPWVYDARIALTLRQRSDRRRA